MKKANNEAIKVAVIGGGSTYTPELIAGFIERTGMLPLSELCLMDIDEERLSIVGGFAQRMVQKAGSPFAVTLSTDRRSAINGAAYVLTQLRVGGMPARREDEYLGRRHGLVGQETTGVGGMAKALRTIPVLMEIAGEMRELAPDAPLINFTNPAGLVTQALASYAPDIEAIGVCNAPITTKMRILDGLAEDGLVIEPERAHLQTLGLNHLSWHRGFMVDGENIWPRIMEVVIADQEKYALGTWDIDTLRTLQMIPNYYLEYFYYTARKIKAQKDWPPSRADEVMEIEDRLLAFYGDKRNTAPPPDLMERGGAYYSTVATQLLNAHYNNSGETHIVNVRNGDAVSDWPADWVLEIPSIIDRCGAVPLPAEPLPPEVFGLIAAVKSYELLTAEAAVKGDRDAAYKALLVHPLGPSADQIGVVLNDMLKTNIDYLVQFR